MRCLVVPLLLVAAGCSRDGLVGATGDPAVDGAAAFGLVDRLADRPADLALAPRDSTFPSGDMAHPMCVGAVQPADPVNGVANGLLFTAHVAVAGWHYGEGACNGQPTVYLFDGALPPEAEIPVARGLQLFDPTSSRVDMGALRQVNLAYSDGATVHYGTGTVEWLRRDDFRQPGGVLEGNLFADGPMWSLKGHFVANRCEILDQVCL